MFLNGGSGKDKLTGGAGADTIYGLGGDDSLSGLGGEDVLAGNEGNDTLSGGGNDDYLMGGLGNDRIDGGTGFDWAGYEDAIAAVRVDLALTTAQNTLGAGTDQLVSIEYVHGSSYADTLSGSATANYIFGGDGNDQLFGRAGDDFLAGGAGDDLIDGGANDDTVSFDDGVAGGVVVNLITQTADGHGHDSLVSIESVYGSGDNDSIVGNDVDNYLFGGAGADTIVAGAGADYVDGDAGNDLIVGGAGDDYVLGGGGADTFSFDDGVVGGVNASLLAMAADGHGHEVLVSIENVIGSAYADTISGDGENNYIQGGNGIDLLSGDAGNDTLVGGQGDDVIVGGSGVDAVSYADGIAGGVSVGLYNHFGLGLDESSSGHGYDSLSSIENVFGTAYSDVISGDTSANFLSGGAGNDFIGGHGGQDTLEGGEGDDRIFAEDSTTLLVLGGSGFDSIEFDRSGSGPVHQGLNIDLAATGAQQVNDLQLVTLSSVESVNGTSFADTMYASAETNLLDGNSGGDLYVFRSLADLGNGATADTVGTIGLQDRIDLSAIDADITTAGNQAFHFLPFVAGPSSSPYGSEFTGHAGEISESYDPNTDRYSLRFDVDGDRVADATLWIKFGAAAEVNFIL